MRRIEKTLQNSLLSAQLASRIISNDLLRGILRKNILAAFSYAVARSQTTLQSEPSAAFLSCEIAQCPSKNTELIRGKSLANELGHRCSWKPMARL